MGSEKKEYSRSIRMTKTVQEIVEAFEGEGFNQKFENLVLSFKQEEQTVKKRVAEKKRELERINKEIAQTQDICRTLNEIKQRLSPITKLATEIENKAKKLV